MSDFGNRQYQSSIKNKKAFIAAYLANNGDVRRAMTSIGLTLHTYKYWRRTDPDFRSRFDALRSSKEGKKEAYSGDFGAFRKMYFGYDTYQHQQKLVWALEHGKPQQVTMCLLPPEHGKTSTVEDYISFKLGKDPNHRFAVVSESINHARKIVRKLQRRMNPREATEYISEFGPFYMDGQQREGKAWAADYFTIARADHDERDFSVAAAGWSSAVYGSRWDTLIIDDIQSRRSINRTEEMVRTIRQDMFSRIGRKGHIVFIGTRVGPGDVYETLLDEDVVNELIRLPAIDPITHEALCPELWPLDALEKKKAQVGPEVWATAYQQNPISQELATFNEEMVQAAKDFDRISGKTDPSSFVVFGVDPALGGWNVVVAAEYSSDELRLIDIDRVKGLARNEDIFDRIELLARHYKPSVVIVERTAMQKGLARDQRLQYLGSKYGFLVKEHETANQKSDANTFGVSAMGGSFIRKELRVPFGDEASRIKFGQLLDELRRWRPGVSGGKLEQDSVMATWFVWKDWMTVRETLKYEAKNIWKDVPSWVRGVA